MKRMSDSRPLRTGLQAEGNGRPRCLEGSEGVTLGPPKRGAGLCPAGDERPAGF